MIITTLVSEVPVIKIYENQYIKQSQNKKMRIIHYWLKYQIGFLINVNITDIYIEIQGSIVISDCQFLLIAEVRNGQSPSSDLPSLMGL